MVGNYGVFFGNQQVGKVQVQRQGLYYRFICRCRLSGEGMYRLFISCGGDQVSLGIVVPMGDGFGLETRLPVKRFREGEPEFSLIPKQEAAVGQFAPIIPEEPFAYIERLKSSFLVRKYGQMGIMLEDHREISSPTGQWSEPITSE